MDVILVPGLWLDSSSWDAQRAPLEAAGHTVHALTMPGLGEPAAASSGIGLADWIAATVTAIDAVDGRVALVGHSGGGNVVWGAADARVERIERVVFVDTFPPADGGDISAFPVVDDVVPFPGWEFFDDADVADLDAATRELWRPRMAAVPARVPTDPIALHDPRRVDLPVTMVTGTFPAAAIGDVIADAPPWAAELGALTNLEIVEVHSGHWPQFTVPDALATALVEALAR
ncbi:alpha/beta fold hydrolase [Microbacterium sp. P04]|uniref:alpha/beta fold hydrolase n=1 Tax=Microbacterium sp. P04 TaxID=3366947 RepID=UPI0037463102